MTVLLSYLCFYCHPRPDRGSRILWGLWIPAFAGMAVFCYSRLDAESRIFCHFLVKGNSFFFMNAMDSRFRGNDRDGGFPLSREWQLFCYPEGHSLPCHPEGVFLPEGSHTPAFAGMTGMMDSRFRGNDKGGRGYDKRGVWQEGEWQVGWIFNRYIRWHKKKISHMLLRFLKMVKMHIFTEFAPYSNGMEMIGERCWNARKRKEEQAHRISF